MIFKAFQDPALSPRQPVFVTLWWSHPDLTRIFHSLCSWQVGLDCLQNRLESDQVGACVWWMESIRKSTDWTFQAHLCACLRRFLAGTGRFSLTEGNKFSRHNQRSPTSASSSQHESKNSVWHCLHLQTSASRFLFWCLPNIVLNCTVQPDYRHTDEVQPAAGVKNARFLSRSALYSSLFFSFCRPEQSDFLGRKNDSCSHFIETLIILIIVFISCSFVRVWLNSIPHVGNLLIWFWSVS